MELVSAIHDDHASSGGKVFTSTRRQSPIWHGCSGASPDQVANVFRHAIELMDDFWPQWMAVMSDPNLLIQICRNPSVEEVTCIPGYVNAIAVAVRIILDVVDRRCSQAHERAIVGVCSESPVDWVHHLVGNGQIRFDGNGGEQRAALARDLQQALGWVTMPLLFLDSSPWPLKLANVTAIVGELVGDPRFGIWRHPMGGGSWNPDSRTAPLLWTISSPTYQALFQHAGLPIRIRVWSVGLHATLAMEPESIWTDVLSQSGLWDISVENVLAINYCNVGNLGRCTTHGPISDLLKQHVVKSAPAMNRINKFPHVLDPEGFSRKFLILARTDDNIAKADILMCSEPPFFCSVLAFIGKPVFGYWGNPFGAYLREVEQKSFYARFHDVLATNKRNTFATMSSHLSALIYWHTGVAVPSLQPLGAYTQAVYRPQLADVLVTKIMFARWDVLCVLNEFAEALRISEVAAMVKPWKRLHNATRFVSISGLTDRSWENWGRHRAAVVLPYDPQQMVFHELYSMGLPLLVPNVELLSMLTRRGYTNIRDFDFSRPGWQVPKQELAYSWNEDASIWELRWWNSLSEYVRAPHLLTWGSVPEILQILFQTNLDDVSSKMRQETTRRIVASSDFWRAAFARALLPEESGK